MIRVWAINLLIVLAMITPAKAVHYTFGNMTVDVSPTSSGYIANGISNQQDNCWKIIAKKHGVYHVSKEWIY